MCPARKLPSACLLAHSEPMDCRRGLASPRRIYALGVARPNTLYVFIESSNTLTCPAIRWRMSGWKHVSCMQDVSATEYW